MLTIRRKLTVCFTMGQATSLLSGDSNGPYGAQTIDHPANRLQLPAIQNPDARSFG